MTRIRVVLADDHSLLLDALQRLLHGEQDIEVVGCCTRGDDVAALVRQEKPDVLILDHIMAGANGIEVLRQLRHQPESPRTIILSGLIEDDEVIEAIRLGARGVLTKDMAFGELVACVRDVHAGGEWLPRDAGARAVRSLLRRERATREVGTLLTPRELQLVRYVAGGMRNRQIADLLNISEGTVKIHLHHVYEKVGMQSRVALAVWAKNKGLA
jgi:DNA-binding NarL/FixJ family response regulator